MAGGMLKAPQQTNVQQVVRAGRNGVTCLNRLLQMLQPVPIVAKASHTKAPHFVKSLLAAGLTSVAAARSTLSTPTPARPTTFKRPLAASNTARVTWHGSSSTAEQGR